MQATKASASEVTQKKMLALKVLELHVGQWMKVPTQESQMARPKVVTKDDSGD